MSVLVFAENWEGKFKKATFEAISYAKSIAEMAGTDLVAACYGEISDSLDSLAKYGADKIVHIAEAKQFDSNAFANHFSELAKGVNASHVVLSMSNNGKMLGAATAAKLNTGYISNVSEAPSSVSPTVVKKKVFSGKGIAEVKSEADTVILGLVPNAFGVKEQSGAGNTESANSYDSSSAKTEVVSQDRATGKITLSEAEIVVSAGRGLKGPENWGMVEELADLLGAATACSKPVSDVGWRPHTEHVGQTGKAIGPNLYIAIGISGAIQHLAGVNSSKVIVVINSDPEAPFFKAADYGIVGDAFEVVPRLVEAVKSYKAQG